ncbi:hypothetical protein BDZ97DRAFT_1784151 [Flammula alnicola]|nr:hypothetical protein BDZ97DRAFT_1784151 [Flammula alnicola]
MWSPEDGVPTHTSEITMICQVISRYFWNWFSHRNIAQLRLTLSFKAFSVSQHPGPDTDVPHFDVDIYAQNCAQLPIILPLLDAFSSCDLTNVTTLSFATNLFSNRTLDSNVQHFLLSLPSIETLETTLDSLKQLLPLPDNISAASDGYGDYICRPVFPFLRIVKIYELGIKTLPSDASTIFLSFLTWRTHAGVPIQTLDLTTLKLFAKMEFLEEVEGLKVIWKKGEDIEEYVCGSGNAQRLHFEF